MVQVAPRWARIAAKFPQQAPTKPQYRPSLLQDVPRWSKDGPRWPQHGRKWSKMSVVGCLGLLPSLCLRFAFALPLPSEWGGAPLAIRRLLAFGDFCRLLAAFGSFWRLLAFAGFWLLAAFGFWWLLAFLGRRSLGGGIDRAVDDDARLSIWGPGSKGPGPVTQLAPRDPGVPTAPGTSLPQGLPTKKNKQNS